MKSFWNAIISRQPPPFDEESALKVYQEWIDSAEFVKDVVDPDTAIEESVIGILITKRDFYRFDLLKSGQVPPQHGFFINDNGIIYVESELFRDLLHEIGVKEKPEKVSKACRRILAGKTKLIRLGKDNKNRRYFWRFNLKAIQAILRREGDDWSPEIHENFEIKDVLEKIGLKKEEEAESQTETEDQEEQDEQNPVSEEIIDFTEDPMKDELERILSENDKEEKDQEDDGDD